MSLRKEKIIAGVLRLIVIVYYHIWTSVRYFLELAWPCLAQHATSKLETPLTTKRLSKYAAR